MQIVSNQGHVKNQKNVLFTNPMFTFFFGAKFCANNVPAPYGALCTLCFQKQIQSCNEFLTFDVYNAKFIFYQYGWWLINL